MKYNDRYNTHKNIYISFSVEGINIDCTYLFMYPAVQLLNTSILVLLYVAIFVPLYLLASVISRDVFVTYYTDFNPQ